MRLKGAEGTEGGCEHGDNEESHNSSEGGNNPVEEVTTEEGRGNTEGEETECDQPGVVHKILNETGLLEGGAADGMGCLNVEEA